MIILHLCTKNLDDMIKSFEDMECDALKLVILGHFLHFYPPKSSKNQNFEKMRYHHFTHVYQKSQSYDVQFLRYGVRQTELFVILGLFLSFYSLNNSENKNFEKMKKFAWKNLHFTDAYHKWRSYDVGFLI